MNELNWVKRMYNVFNGCSLNGRQRKEIGFVRLGLKQRRLGFSIKIPLYLQQT